MAEVIGKIFYKLELLAKDFLLRATLFLGSPRLTAWALSLVAGEVNSRGEFTVLCMGRSIFINDVKALASFSGRLKYVVIHRRYWKTIFYYCLDDDEKSLIEEANYHQPNFCEKGKKKYFDYLGKLLPVLQTKLGFAAVLSGNFGYVEQQELAAVCEKNNIPFIVLHKEAMDAYGGDARRYQTLKFIGTKLLLYNEKIKEILLALNVPGILAEKVGVVGMPRADFYFARTIRKPKDGQIVFFSFYPEDKLLSLISDKTQHRLAQVQYADFHKLVMNFAKRHPEVKLIIKTKSSHHFVQYVEGIIKENLSEDLKNLVLTNSGDSFELILDSQIVIGFNSTALIEAVIAGRPIICPDFRGLAPDNSWDVFADYGEFLRYVRSEEDLEKYWSSVSQFRGFEPKQKKVFLTKLLFNSDGQASKRAETEILTAINEYRIKSL